MNGRIGKFYANRVFQSGCKKYNNRDKFVRTKTKRKSLDPWHDLIPEDVFLYYFFSFYNDHFYHFSSKSLKPGTFHSIGFNYEQILKKWYWLYLALEIFWLGFFLYTTVWDKFQKKISEKEYRRHFLILFFLIMIGCHSGTNDTDNFEKMLW